MLKKLSFILFCCFVFVGSSLRAEDKIAKYPVNLYFFWGEGCPHCSIAKPFLENLKKKYPLLTVKDYEIYSSAENRSLFSDMADAYEVKATGVPTFFIGDESPLIGFSEITGISIEKNIIKCLVDGCVDSLSKMAISKASPIIMREELKTKTKSETDTNADAKKK